MTRSTREAWLLHELADRLDENPPPDWSPAMLKALIALLDVPFAEGGRRRHRYSNWSSDEERQGGVECFALVADRRRFTMHEQYR